ncbi:MAG: S1 RNA-binding domain-containing protein [Clostridia bacterium]|nr:S1 RNA-binding domain-containing protein [Clostridia bacterium]
MSNEIGAILEGKITSITNFGAFVAFPDGKSGMIHISEVADGFVKDINDYLKIGQSVKVKICSIDEKGRVSLSLKQVAVSDAVKQTENVQSKKRIVPDSIEPSERSSGDFEDMISRFMKTSNEKISDLRRTTDSKISSPGFFRKNSKKY